MKSYTLRPDTFTLNFNVTISGTESLDRHKSSAPSSGQGVGAGGFFAFTEESHSGRSMEGVTQPVHGAEGEAAWGEASLLWLRGVAMDRRGDGHNLAARQLTAALRVLPPPAVSSAMGTTNGRLATDIKADLMTIRERDARREGGNDEYKKGRYAKAYDEYSAGLKLDLSHDVYNAVLYCNRAAALSAMKLYAEAMADCSSALERKGGAYPKVRNNLLTPLYCRLTPINNLLTPHVPVPEGEAAESTSRLHPWPARQRREGL